jgi:hypothetical protein
MSRAACGRFRSPAQDPRLKAECGAFGTDGEVFRLGQRRVAALAVAADSA